MIEAISAIQAAIQTAQKLRELSKKIEDADIKMALADLADSLADAKLAAADLKGQVSDLMEDNQSLREQLKQRESEKPKFDGGLYYFGDDEHPFCTACWDKAQQRIRLARIPKDFRFSGEWTCPVCGADYGASAFD